MNNNLFLKIENHVSKIFENKIKNELSFHNLGHTKQVVKFAAKIASNSKCTEEEIKIVKIAAWFHDAGFLKTYEGHEEESVKIAEKFLTQVSFNSEAIEKIKTLIRATRIKYEPKTICEKVIRDADLAHLGTQMCPIRQRALKKELERVLEFSYTDIEWLKININFMQDHEFYTDYAKEKFGPKKNENLQMLKNKLKHLN